MAGDGRGRWRRWRGTRRVGRAVKPHRAHGGERAEGRGLPAARQLPTLTSAPRPSRLLGAGGARRSAGGVAWARRGRPGSPGIAASAAASGAGAAATASAGTGGHGMWGHSPPPAPDVTTAALLSSDRPSSFQCPQSPNIPNKHPSTIPGRAHHPQ